MNEPRPQGRKPDAPAVGMTGARFGSPKMRRREAMEADTDKRTVTGPPVSDAPQIGYTGARFGSPKLRRRLDAEAVDADTVRLTSEPDPEVSDGAQVGYTGARFGPAEKVRHGSNGGPPTQPPPPRPHPDQPRYDGHEPATAYLGAGQTEVDPGWPGPDWSNPGWTHPGWPDPAWTDPGLSGPADAYEEPPALVRPYARTRGRTRSHSDLALETLVTVSGWISPESWGANPEYRAVVDICAVPRSIAEVAALSSLPVGVARVLVGDMAELGLLTVHDATRPADAAADLMLMHRVLEGLRRL